MDKKQQLELLNKSLLTLSSQIKKADNCNAYDFDSYLQTIINRTISLNKAFITLVDDKNSFSAVSIVRLQLDNAIRLHAIKVTDNPQEFFKHFFDGKPINKYPPGKGKDKFSDKFLVTKLDEEIPGVMALYDHLCNFVHLSYTHFKAAQIPSKNPDALFTLDIGESDIFNLSDINEYYVHMIKISYTLVRSGTEWVLQKNLVG